MKSRSDFSVENVERIFASYIELPSSNENFSSTRGKKSVSEPDIGYSVNYDDLCGPWKYPQNPAHTNHDFPVKPQFCVWGLLTKENMSFVRNFLNDEIAFKRFIGQSIFFFFSGKFNSFHRNSRKPFVFRHSLE